MSLRISNLYMHSYNMSFNGLKSRTIKNIGYAMMASSMLFTAASCANKDKNIASETEIDKTFNSTKNDIKKLYHYYPRDIIDSNQYDWFEMIYPDGRVEKDSAGHIISITADGQRTDTYTKKNSNGDVTSIKLLPDGTKIERTDYKMQNPLETLYSKKTFWKNGNLKENIYHNEYPPDNTNSLSKKIIEESIEKYNENEVLLSWKSTCTDPERNENNNLYDRKGRLIYDDVKNEKYQYKGNQKIPYRSVSVYEDCKRITLYNKDGSVRKIYFQASDGTITSND